MKLAFITDEATQSFEEAVRLAKRCGLAGLELRSICDRPVEQIPHGQLKEWRARLDAEGLTVCNLASSFCKCEPEETVPASELEKLSLLCDAADILGCETIRGFAFFVPKEGRIMAEGLAPFFELPAKLLRERGKRLLLEADPSVNTTNHRTLSELLALLDREVFGAIYDPGNDIYDPLGETPFPEGYRAVASCLSHVHIKDAIVKEGKPICVKLGTGLVDYPGILCALAEEGYEGWLSLEPHYRKSLVLTEEQMRTPKGADFSRGGTEALVESAQALKALIRGAEKKACGEEKD